MRLPITKHDLDLLKQTAIAAHKHAYAVYSNFHVGAAVLGVNGQIYGGCNVENASFGLTLCAERNCIAQGIANGEKSFTALLIYTQSQTLTPPCGACRQVIAEFFSKDALIIAVNQLGEQQSWQLAELLPNAFTKDNL
jgi:cytidine deaminase